MRVWAAIARGLEGRGSAVLVSIRDPRGSTPREAGARMVVFSDGTFTGTIGGGTLEWRALAEAQRLFNDRHNPSSGLRAPSPSRGEGAVGEELGHVESNDRPHRLLPLREKVPEGRMRGMPQAEYRTAVHPEIVSDLCLHTYALGPELGQCCGGRVTVAIEIFGIDALPTALQLADLEDKGPFTTEGFVADGQFARRLIGPGAGPALTEVDGVVWETFGEDRRTLVLFGAGHVGRALVLALAPLPFRVIWVDPRPGAFPGAVPANVTLVRPQDPVALLDDIEDGTQVLVMTHSHALDLDLVAKSLQLNCFSYVGVIGSATKRARFESRLRSLGIADVERMICPIGALGPKSKHPAVIAASVAVELVMADEAARAACGRESLDVRSDQPSSAAELVEARA